MLLLLLLLAQEVPRSIEHELYRAQIAAAESALRLGELSIARAWLDETDAVRRGFEWQVHDALLDESMQNFAAGASEVTALDVSPDGSQQLWGHADGAVELRTTADGALIALLGAHAAAVSCVRFDAAGLRAVSSSQDRTVKVWNLTRSALAVNFTAHGFPVASACFSPDGLLVASCSYERPPNSVIGTLHLWNAADGTLVRTLHGGRKPLVGLQFSPDGQRIAAGSWDFCAFVWEVTGGEPRTFPIPEEGLYNAVDSVAWSPDGALLAAASRDRTARLWRVESGELVATLRGHADEVRRVAFAPQAPLLATGAADGSVKLWSSVDGALQATLQGHSAAVADLRFAPHGRQLYSAGKDATVRAWETNPDLYGGARVQSTSTPYVARWSPDERIIATASYDGRISLFDGASLTPLTSWQAHPQSCHALGWTAGGKMLVSGSWESVLRIWDAEQGTELAAFEQGEGTTDLAVSPDGRFAAACAGAKVFVYDLEQRAVLHVFTGHRVSALAVNFSPDSRRCISTGRDGRALVWDARSGALIHDIAVPDPEVAAAAFTPDGRQVVIAGRSSGLVLLHDAATGARVRELAHLRQGIQHLDISPDGSRAVLAADSLVLVDLTNGRDVGHLRPHHDNPYNVDFDARGGRLLSCSTDGSIAVSDTRPLRERLAPGIGPR